MTSTSGSETTDDAFLGGRLNILQPRIGYRAGVDPVLLAASVPARPGQGVLDLGCGAGAAMLCLHARVPGLELTGVEVQADYAALAARNISRNGAMGRVVVADLVDLPAEIRARRFDHVIANPPYYGRDQGTASADTGRDIAFGGATALADWVGIAAKRCAPKGYVTMIQRAERLPEMLSALPASLGSVVVLPLCGRAGRMADRVILQARQNGRRPFRLLAPLVLHSGERHDEDTPDYAPAVHDVLKNSAALPLQS